jgi:hypothetical protein
MEEIKLGGIKFPKKSRPLAPPKNSPDKDIWMTPPDLAQKIVQYFGPSGDMIEPCMGDGSFYFPMKEYSSDGEVDWCELSKGRNFLEKDFCGQKYDWLITNYPFSKYADFLEKSMQVAENIVTYGTVCHILSLKKRLRLIKEAGFFIREILYTDTPKEWNTGGFACGAIYLNKQKGDCKISYLQ